MSKVFNGPERRYFPLVEVRASEDERKIVGHAAVFNAWSDDLGGFREKVMPGCFAETIVTDDIRCLFNHDYNYPLGRRTAGTLTLREDERGLYFEATPPDTQWARDLMVSISRGDVDQCSFAFHTKKDVWGTDEEGEYRELHKVQLYDVGPVTFPAYPQTDAGVRAMLHEAGIDFGRLSIALTRPERTDDDIRVITASIEALTRYLPADCPGAGVDVARRRLELIALKALGR